MRAAGTLAGLCVLAATLTWAAAAQADGSANQSAPLPNGSQTAVVAPARPFTAILLGSSQLGWVSESALEAQYALWGRDVHVQPAFRGLTPNPNDPTMLGWERHGYRYVWTVASSDYATAGEPLYVCTANQPTCKGTLDSVLSRPGCIGLFMHEVVSDLAAGNGWDWATAGRSLDWATIALYETEARRYGKKLIWSEPAFGWQALAANATFASLATDGGPSLVPMFATNFPADVPYASAAASAVVHTYAAMQLGESLQSWYFRDQGLTPTVSGTEALAQQGLALGATWYEVDGAPPDMQTTPRSLYMQGVDTFIGALPR
ncbi:MAG: hypothetical protein ACRDLP_02475 [Solirubrobacteraceae bacterium]